MNPAQLLRRMSEYFDRGLSVDLEGNQRSDECIYLHRIMKAVEEIGEACSAAIGKLGANPRKGIYATQENVNEELLDVACSALGAYEHMTGNNGLSLQDLQAHICKRAERVGIVEETPEKLCATCKHALLKGAEEPCCSCKIHSRWEPDEQAARLASARTTEFARR